MSNHTVSLTLQLRGQQAQQVLNQLNNTQNKSADALLRSNRMLEGVLRQQAIQTRIQTQSLQQLTRLNQQNTNSIKQGAQASNDSLRTNRLLEQVLRQQTRQSSLQSQQLKNQNRDYQLQLNTLRQQAAAAQRLQEQLRGASREQRNLGSGGGFSRLNGIAGVVGGVYAAGMYGSNYLKDPRDYMRQISLSTDTALAGQSISPTQYNQKIKEMEGYARHAAVAGGSSPQQVGMALNTLTAANVFDFKEYKDVLYQVSRTAFASGADANDLSLTAVAQKNFGLTDLARANDQAFRAGQLGSFELRDMARYMPDLLTQGKNAGYIGDTGYRNLLTMMQMSKKTAGTSEGAAVNLSDLLGSFSQYHLGLSMAKFIKLDAGDPIAKYGVSKKRSGFDWATYAANMRAQGVGEVEAAGKLMNRQMSKSPLYLEYQQKLLTAQKNGDTKAVQENLQAATNIAAQSEIGKIFHNKQALLAFMGISMNMGAGGAYEMVDQGIRDSKGAVDASHARQASQEYAKDSSLDTARFNARLDVYNGNAGWLGSLKQTFADFASNNQGIAAAASAAVAGLTAVGIAGGIAALAMRGGGVGAAGAGAAGAAAGAASRFAPVAAVAGAGLAGYTVGSYFNDYANTKPWGKRLGDAVGHDITETMAFFGNDQAQDAMKNYALLESNNHLIELVKQQEEQNRNSKAIADKLDALALANKDWQPILNFNGMPMMGAMDQQAKKESNRHGSAPFYLQKH